MVLVVVALLYLLSLMIVMLVDSSSDTNIWGLPIVYGITLVGLLMYLGLYTYRLNNSPCCFPEMIRSIIPIAITAIACILSMGASTSNYTGIQTAFTVVALVLLSILTPIAIIASTGPGKKWASTDIQPFIPAANNRTNITAQKNQ